MKAKRQKVSPSAEEYLLTLYRLESTNERVGSSQLAKMFGVKAPSVTGMLRRLHERGWVHYRRYRPPELTEEGRTMAVRLIRRHRLLETFLVEFLDFGWEEVHEEVQILEHAVTDRLLQRIDQKLNHPSFDPHGDPIPAPDGHLPDHKLVPLTRLEEGAEAELGRVDNRSRNLLRILGEVGAFPGTRVRRMENRPDGSLLLRVGEKELDLDRDIARLIWVKPEPSSIVSS
jgi:DtxR family Mn-dependent transcriptional regulator